MNFFTNITAYQLSNADIVNEQELEKLLSGPMMAFHDCPPSMPYTSGFAPVREQEGEHTITTHQFVHLRFRSEKRMLPADVVERETDKLVAEREEQVERALTKKERKAIKEGITQRLLPEAFTRLQDTRAIYNAGTGVLFIDSATKARCEAIVSRLAGALAANNPDEPVTYHALPLSLNLSAVMSQWLLDTAPPDGFDIEPEITLEDITEPERKAAYSHWNRDDSDLDKLIRHGFQVRRQRMSLGDSEFTLDADSKVRRIKWHDPALADDDSESDASYLLLADTLAEFWSRLRQACDNTIVEEDEDERETA